MLLILLVHVILRKTVNVQNVHQKLQASMPVAFLGVLLLMSKTTWPKRGVGRERLRGVYQRGVRILLKFDNQIANLIIELTS